MAAIREFSPSLSLSRDTNYIINYRYRSEIQTHTPSNRGVPDTYGNKIIRRVSGDVCFRGFLFFLFFFCF